MILEHKTNEPWHMFEDAPASNPFNVKVQDLTVGALVELVAVLLVGVELEAVGLWAGGVLGRGAGSQAEENESKCLHGHSAKSTGLLCTALGRLQCTGAHSE